MREAADLFDGRINYLLMRDKDIVDTEASSYNSQPKLSWEARYWLVFTTSLVMRLVAAYIMRHAPVRSDAQDYLQVAGQIARGEHFYPYWPPGVPLFLAPLIAFGAGELAIRISMLVFWILCCWSLYRLMQTMNVLRFAWVGLLIFSLLPDAIELSIEPLTQVPTAAFLLLALSAFAEIARSGLKREYGLLAIALGCMALIRPSSALLIVVLPLCCFLVRRQLMPAVCAALIAFIFMGCWLVRAKQMTGDYVFNTANAVNLYYGNNPWTPDYKTWYFGSHAKIGDEEVDTFPEYKESLLRVYALPFRQQPQAFQHLAMKDIRGHFGRFLYRTSNRIRCFLGFDTFTGSGLAGVRWHQLPLAPAVLLLELLTYLALMLPTVFWLTQAPKSFWKEPTHMAIPLACALYALPYWLSMSHPTYHFPMVLPLVVMGACAWHVSHGTKIHARAWISVALFLVLQAEWIIRMTDRTH